MVKMVSSHAFGRQMSTLQRWCRHLLDSIGSLLHAQALEDNTWDDENDTWALLPGNVALSSPLGSSSQVPPVPVCMLLNKVKVSNTVHFQMKNGYANMVLGMIGPLNIIEGVHRFALWAMFGPPSPTIQHPVVMHSCHNRLCINPLHLVWGELAENADRRRGYADRYSRQRLNDRKDPITDWLL